MPSISVFVISPYAFVCDLLQHRLGTQSDLSCAGTWQTVSSAEEEMERVRPDVVVLDTALCDLEVSRVIADCLKRHADLAFVLLYDSETLEKALDCFTAGARAAISKHCEFDRLADTIRAAARGEPIVPIDLLVKMVERLHSLRRSDEAPAASPLAARETTMLMMITQGASNQDIATRLGIHPQTVKNSLTKLFRKLGVTNRFQAAAWWRDRHVET